MPQVTSVTATTIVTVKISASLTRKVIAVYWRFCLGSLISEFPPLLCADDGVTSSQASASRHSPHRGEVQSWTDGAAAESSGTKATGITFPEAIAFRSAS